MSKAYLQARLSERDVKFEKKLPVFHDVKDPLVDDVIGLRVKSGLQILSRSKAQTKV